MPHRPPHGNAAIIGDASLIGADPRSLRRIQVGGCSTTSAAKCHGYIILEQVCGLALAGKVPQATTYVVSYSDH